MSDSVEAQLAELEKMTISQLIARFEDLHGYPCRSRHRQYLFRKNAWRIQANAFGDLSERARRRAEELANDADVRTTAPKTIVSPPQGKSAKRTVAVAVPTDPRLPAPGSAILRPYKGRTLRVVVLPDDGGFEFEGERYGSLTAIAKKVTGSHINGFRFFRLKEAE
jgi:hypothetical protein